MKWGTRIGIAVATLALTIGICQWGMGGRRVKKSDVSAALVKLKSGSPEQKTEAAKLLGNVGSVRVTYVKGAIGPLKSVFLKEKNAKLRAAAAEALGKIGLQQKEMVMMFTKALKNKKEDAAVKIAAMQAIARMPKEARPAMGEIRKIMRDKDKKNRQLRNVARNVWRSLRTK